MTYFRVFVPIKDPSCMAFENERFGDYEILMYAVPGFDDLSPKQRIFIYYLALSGFCGRDIFYDQNFKHNIEIRHALEALYIKAHPHEQGAEWNSFVCYLKTFWFSNGLHHHYESSKLPVNYPLSYLQYLSNKYQVAFPEYLIELIFNPLLYPKKVEKNADFDLVSGAAVNFYGENITQQEVTAFYEDIKVKNPMQPLSYGLNSKLERNEYGKMEELTYKVHGLYGAALKMVVHYLRLAQNHAENLSQVEALELLISYYETGDLQNWDDFNVKWVGATEGEIDFIHGFVEVYEDPLSRKGTFECIVQIKDPEASKKMQVMTDHIDWFESNAPIDAAFKKDKPQGVSYAIMNVVAEAGDAAPATPIGVNLPNADWIRAAHGSKSVSLANIEAAYDKAGGAALLHAFCFDAQENARAEKWGSAASKLHTALHEVIGHGSGKLAPGVGTPKETLKNFANTIEETRADLVALYFMGHPELHKMGLVPEPDFYMAEYDQYIRNGLLLQLRRVTLGGQIEEDHMRNRQLIAKWVLEKGRDSNTIEKLVRNNKTFYKINDYSSLRVLFGQLLKEIQRIKSTGDYLAAKHLVTTYAVEVDADLHLEVLNRVAPLNLPKFYGFVQPELLPVFKNGNIIDVALGYPESFAAQMLAYAKNYSILNT